MLEPLFTIHDILLKLTLLLEVFFQFYLKKILIIKYNDQYMEIKIEIDIFIKTYNTDLKKFNY